MPDNDKKTEEQMSEGVTREAVRRAMEDARQWLRRKIEEENRNFPVQYGDVMSMRLRSA